MTAESCNALLNISDSNHMFEFTFRVMQYWRMNEQIASL